ncbi:MAG: T9SS type A sorting domain-containing protein [Bacteroidetes bacterium]|nr:T9SS type A sorting domain-containing protein [Bacteroidota bacterium]
MRLTIVARIISTFQAFTFAGNNPGGNNIRPLSGFILFKNKSEFSGMIVLIQKYNYSQTIYPNPSIGEVVIRLQFFHIGISHDKSLNIMGELVFDRELAVTKMKVDLIGIAKGLYIVKVVNGDNVMNRKLILQ